MGRDKGLQVSYKDVCKPVLGRDVHESEGREPAGERVQGLPQGRDDRETAEAELPCPIPGGIGDLPNIAWLDLTLTGGLGCRE